jgi:predicted RNase H-like HicB family nuclease
VDNRYQQGYRLRNLKTCPNKPSHLCQVDGFYATHHFRVQFWHECSGVDMTRQFDVIVEKDSAGYFVASVPALPGCHTQAKSLDDLMERIREAIELCLEVQGEVLEPLDFVGVQRISIAA